MSDGNTNSVPPFFGASNKELLETIGVTQFPSDVEWFQVIGGLVVQGGYVEIPDTSSLVINLPAPVSKQILGIYTQVVGQTENGAYIDNITLSEFELFNGAGDRFYYWWAIGV